jgi:hypothetical protein
MRRSAHTTTALAAALIAGALASCGGSASTGAPREAPPATPTLLSAFAPQQSSFGASALTPRPLGAEPVIAQTSTPAVASLALRFQPTVRMSIYDRFWPVSVAAALDEQADGKDICLDEPPAGCVASPPTLAELKRAASHSDFLRYPEHELENAEEQFRGFAAGVGASAAAIAQWRSDPALLNPYASAQLYFYDAGNGPYDYKGAPPGLRSLQYWFFYAYNTTPLVDLAHTTWACWPRTARITSLRSSRRASWTRASRSRRRARPTGRAKRCRQSTSRTSSRHRKQLRLRRRRSRATRAHFARVHKAEPYPSA